MARNYTIEELTERASKYNSISEFRKNDESAYNAISRRGLIGQLCVHMKRKLPGNARTDEELMEIASKYNVLKEFREKERGVYDAIRKRGLMDVLCSHMIRDPKIMSEEQLAEIASRYNDYHEFRVKEPLVCQRMQNRNLIKKLCGHMKRSRRDNLTDEDLAEIASRYNYISDFMENDRTAYSLVCRRGLHDKLCGNMERKTRRLSNDDLAKIASKYQTRKEFVKNDKVSYTIACTRGILDEICAHMTWLCKREHHWTKELCYKEALKYSTKLDFLRGNGAAYSSATQHGWINDICKHMVPRGNWVKRKVYVFTFSDGYAYVGLTQDISRRYREHVSKGKKVSPILKHIQDTGATFEFKELTGWLAMDKAAQEEDRFMKQYALEGWKMLNKSPAGSLGASREPYYTPRRIKQEIAKYEYYEDFIKGSRRIYKYLQYHHSIEEYCSHMKRRKRVRIYWTLERAISVVPGCKNRSEYQKKYGRAYHILKENGLLNKYFPR